MGSAWKTQLAQPHSQPASSKVLALCGRHLGSVLVGCHAARIKLLRASCLRAARASQTGPLL